jgi:hypothetical protein
MSNLTETTDWKSVAAKENALKRVAMLHATCFSLFSLAACEFHSQASGLTACSRPPHAPALLWQKLREWAPRRVMIARS